ncbi:hypothetical protein [Pseudoalteromonas carrageenovora]|uniref:hypothetical protein n=1 Tax=Pseudoalteromonas carrageenovora TaxID=227 RepID=UPI0026E39C5E|nr:hypothetical protein [Pseudoalteromonas carrageenovora]MDO6462977.1 hypothetical protein [Pseudoalteromonas carrageenovora]
MFKVSKNNKSTFKAIKRRHFLACVVALITAVIIIPGMTTYLPFHMNEQIFLPFHMNEQILLPIMLFPIIWVGLFMYAYLAEHVWQPFAVMLLLSISHGLLSLLALMQGKA